MKTKTYAEILARQAEYGEALAIYRHLLAKSPDDEGLVPRIAELEALADPTSAAATASLTPPSPKAQQQARRKGALETLLHRIQSRRRP